MADEIITLTDENFKSTIKQGITLVDFWASWCAPCNIITPVIEQVAKDYKDKIKVGKLNVDDNQLTAADFGIVSIPTLILFKDEREETRIVGVVSKDRITEKIEYLLGR